MNVSVKTGALWLLCLCMNAGAQDVVEALPVQAGARAVSPNSVAVLELGIKREHREFFYDEKLDASHSYSGSHQVAAEAPGGRAESADAPRAGYLDTVQRLPVAAEDPADSRKNSARLASSAKVEGQSSLSYSKQFGVKRSFSYQEFRGLMADLKATLAARGYTVIEPRPVVMQSSENGKLPSLQERIAGGDFGAAEFVCVPMLVDIAQRQTREPIQGTNDFSSRMEQSLVVEFSLVNTATMAVVASFNAYGNGADMYLGKDHTAFVPDMARIHKDLLESFAADAKKKLLAQLPKPVQSQQEAGSSNQVAAPAGDPSTLKIYKDPDPAPQGKAGKPKAELKVYR